MASERIEFFIFFFISSLWVQVTEMPELTRMIVLRRGTFIGLNGLISWGGQFIPISMLGEILE